MKRRTPTRTLADALSPEPAPRRRSAPKPKRASSPLTAAFRHLRPSWRSYIEFARMAASDGDDDMVRFVAHYDRLSKREQRDLTPEQVCDQASVKTAALVGSVTEQLWTVGLGESTVVAATQHPRVMLAVAKRAQSPDGRPDAELFLRSTGSLPDKKGAAVTINNNPASLSAAFAQAAAPADAGEPQDAPHPAQGFRSMTSAVGSLDRLLRPAAPLPVVTIETDPD